MIGLGVSADDFEELVWRGARLLRQADCVSNGFAAVLQQVDALPLGDGLWWLHSEQTVKRPGLAFVTPDKPMRYLGQPLNGLFCLASLGEAHQTLLERLCALLIEGRGQELGRATSSRAVLEVLGGELPPDWPSARIALANAHGLHARPAKILAQLAKSFDGDIRVRIVDGAVGAVSVKSLSKLLSLGARRGQVLEFVAEPTIADDALPALLAAVRRGPWRRGRAAAGRECTSRRRGARTDAQRAAWPAARSRPSPPHRASPSARRISRCCKPFDYPLRGESSAIERQRLHACTGRCAPRYPGPDRTQPGQGDPRDFHHPPGNARRPGTDRRSRHPPQAGRKRRSRLDERDRSRRQAAGIVAGRLARRARRRPARHRSPCAGATVRCRNRPGSRTNPTSW